MNLQKLLVVSCAALLLTLTGCETFAGMGRDMQKAGQSIEGAATREKKDDANRQ